MRIHVQNAADDGQFSVTPALWHAAGAPETVTFGSTAEAFVQGIANADALVTSNVALKPHRAALASLAPNLRLIFCTSAGLDGLAPFDWLPPNVALLNNRGAHSARAGEYAAMALLMLAARMPPMLAAQREGRWEKHYGSILAGRRVAIVGTGGLGSAAARQARHFGMRTIGVRTHAIPHPDFDQIVATGDLDAILPEVEFLMLAAPLTPQTHGLIDRHRLMRLPQGAGFINIGRGGLVDQDALCDLLDIGHIAGAVCDVFTPEPIPPGHRLWTTKNLVITPHVSADDPNTYAADSIRIFLTNLAAAAAGHDLPNRFDTTRGY